LLSLIAGVATCDVVGEHPIAGHIQGAHPPSHPEEPKPGAGSKRALVKWPNDVVFTDAGAQADEGPALAKLAGILVEGRPQDGWAVLGIGLNVAVRIDELPADVRARAASLQLSSSAIEPIMGRLMEVLERRLAEPAEGVLDAWRARDALFDREVSWSGGHGRARGIDDEGHLIVSLADDSTVKLDAGEVHLGPADHVQARTANPNN
jgi:BirA family biotin operon repressor/biotin-[acetyl-CoA-carboxylase] ligase